MDFPLRVHVPTPEISEKVQQALFAKGLGWGRAEERPIWLDSQYLFVSRRVRGFVIRRGDDAEYFHNHSHPEVTWQSIVNPKKYKDE